jgi:hypothetical protein
MKRKFRLISPLIIVLSIACAFNSCDDCSQSNKGKTNISKYAKFGSDKTKVFPNDNDDVFITERYVITPPSDVRNDTGWEINYIDFIHCNIRGREHILMSHVIRHGEGVSQTTEHIPECPGCANIKTE